MAAQPRRLMAVRDLQSSGHNVSVYVCVCAALPPRVVGRAWHNDSWKSRCERVCLSGTVSSARRESEQRTTRRTLQRWGSLITCESSGVCTTSCLFSLSLSLSLGWSYFSRARGLSMTVCWKSDLRAEVASEA